MCACVCAGGKSALDGNVEARALMEAAGIGGHSDDIRKADAVGGACMHTGQRQSVRAGQRPSMGRGWAVRERARV